MKPSAHMPPREREGTAAATRWLVIVAAACLLAPSAAERPEKKSASAKSPAAKEPASKEPAAKKAPDREASSKEASTKEPSSKEPSSKEPSSKTPQELAEPDVFPKPKPPEPLEPKAVENAIQRGVAFLLKDQNADGSWGTPQRTKGLNIYAPVPGAHQAFRTAVTALCIAALIEAGGESPAVRKSVERAEAWLMENLPKLRRATPDALYNVWGHAYGVQALAVMHGRLPGDTERRGRIERVIREQFDWLERYESVDGGWGYYDFRVGSQKPATDSTSFQSGAVLVAFDEARRIGVTPPEKLTKRASDSILRQCKRDFSYLYGEYLKWTPMMPINRPGGSLGRSQCCNLALRLWGDKRITNEVLTTWLDRLISRNLWLDMARKRPIPHESHFMVAGYFYYFGHYYAARCIDELPAGERAFYQDHLAHLLLPIQETDGSWWDFPLYNYHQQYGTAFALMSLKRCQRGDAKAK